MGAAAVVGVGVVGGAVVTAAVDAVVDGVVVGVAVDADRTCCPRFPRFPE